MKSHVLRPLWVIIAIVAAILVMRQLTVPKDFGVGERGFMYGYHRAGNVQEWKDFKVKYLTKEYCRNCHPGKYEENMSSKHSIIQCENCHGAALDHPSDPPKLEIDRSRDLCIRCHAYLPYPTSDRMDIKGIDPDAHNPEMECSMCHNPHKPDMGSLSEDK